MKRYRMLVLFLLWIGFTMPVNSANQSDRIDFQDDESVLAHKPILTAHRGGVITPQSPECSLLAIRLAKEAGYSLVELDIQRSADGVPIVFHDRSMMEACGIDRGISELTAEEIQNIPYKGTEEKVVTLDTALAYCRELNLGVMLDLKAQADKPFYDTIADLIRKHHLQNAAITISGNELFRDCVKPVAMITVTNEEFSAVERGDAIDLSNRFWFGLPERLPSEMVAKLQRRGALVMPAINTFRYPEENHLKSAQKDIQRLNQAGVDGYQIDSVYDRFFSK